MNAPYKIFIIDEVHMLTNQAFNALLRTLEEPPEHGKFILATTDIHKVPSTIISRCQRFDFNRINETVISNQLSKIIDLEKIKIDNESLMAISTKADGSMRDALSILDQAIAFSGESITYDEVATIIGIIPLDIFFDYSNALSAKDYPKMFQTLSKIRSSSFQLDDLIDGLNLHFRNYILALTPDGETLMNLNESHKKEYVDTMSSWDLNDILQIINQFNKLHHTIKNSHQPLIAFEILSLKLMEMDKSVIISDLLAENSSNSNSANDKQFTAEQKNFVQNDTKELDKRVKPKADNSSKETSIKIDDISHEKNAEPQPKVKNIGLDKIKDKWQDFIKVVNSERPSLGSTLDHSIPTNIKDNQLTITVSGLPEFSVNNLNHNKELIQKSLSTFYGNEYVLFFSWDSKNSNDVNLANSEPEVREDSKDADKVVEKIIEEFDGEILR